MSRDGGATFAAPVTVEADAARIGGSFSHVAYDHAPDGTASRHGTMRCRPRPAC